jgi:diguanylate cyclase (GGDEF)-like protein
MDEEEKPYNDDIKPYQRLENLAELDNLDDIDPQTGTSEDSGVIDIDDIDNLKEITEKKVIELASGDLAMHFQDDARTLQEQMKKTGTYYQDLIFALIHIRLPEEAAKRDWNEILKHKYTMSETLGRNIGIHVAVLDYYTNIKRKVLNPKIMDAQDFVDTAAMAITDELTRCYNRRFLEEEFKRLFVMAKNAAQPFALIMLDLDHFKMYNDINGHIKGDIALIELVRILHALCTNEDVVARYGGEEFVVLLPGQSLSQAVDKAERLRKGVFDYRFLDEQHLPTGRLTVSVGVTSYRDDIEKPSEMLEEADVAMYRAKNGGRNRVKVFLKDDTQNAPAAHQR